MSQDNYTMLKLVCNMNCVVTIHDELKVKAEHGYKFNREVL